jgi:hypothetical protein
MDLEREISEHHGVALNNALFEDDESFISVNNE